MFSCITLDFFVRSHFFGVRYQSFINFFWWCWFAWFSTFTVALQWCLCICLPLIILTDWFGQVRNFSYEVPELMRLSLVSCSNGGWHLVTWILFLPHQSLSLLDLLPGGLGRHGSCQASGHMELPPVLWSVGLVLGWRLTSGSAVGFADG